MKPQNVYFVVLTLVVAFLSGAGCGRNTTATPPALTAAELPAALEKAFAKAKPEDKELANQVVAALQAKDYPKAFQGVQNLVSLPSHTKEQTSVISSALVTINSLLQEAQAQGDVKATHTIQNYKATK
jgi:hypothetical protein